MDRPARKNEDGKIDDRRVVRKVELRFDQIEKLNEKLFDAVQKCQTENIEKYLRLSANINARDETGCTPIHKAAQNRNYVVQKLLLASGANLRIKDESGCTPLHYVAESGDVESIKLMLAYHANVHATDSNGCTALHYAVHKQHMDATDMLVFCGANALQKDKKGQTPVSLCTQSDIRNVLTVSSLIVEGIKKGDIHVDQAELKSEQSYTFPKVGITIRTSSFGSSSLSFICRRVRPEYSLQLLKLNEKELLLSDTFEYRLSGTKLRGEVVVEMPIYSMPEAHEDVFMKTNGGAEEAEYGELITRNKIKQILIGSEETLVCQHTVNLADFNTFIIVTRPKVEFFPVSNKGQKIVSEVDSYVTLNIPANTFTNKGAITLEMLPRCPLDKNDERTLSLTHFYDVDHTHDEQPQNEVDMTIPLPYDYDGVGELTVLTKDDDERDDDDAWEILPGKPVVKQGRIHFRRAHFSTASAIECQPGTGKKIIKSETNKHHKRSKKHIRSVLFLVMLKPLDKEFQVLIECTAPVYLNQRKNYWIDEGFIDQHPSETGHYKAKPEQLYKIGVSGNIKKQGYQGDLLLEYHPKRKEIFQTFRMQKDVAEEGDSGDINILKKKAEDFVFLTSIQVYPRETTALHNTTKEDETFKGFTNDALLTEISETLGEEWIKLGIKLGFSFPTMEELRTKTTLTPEKKKYKMLLMWRNTTRTRNHYGVPDLLCALRMCDCADIVDLIQERLQDWNKETRENQENFYNWLKSYFLNPEDIVPEVFPEPMSDPFMLALIDEIGIKHEIGQMMELPRAEIDNILTDGLIVSPHHKMLKLLVTARDKHVNLSRAFEALIKALEALDLNDGKNWILETSEEWLRKNPGNTSHFIETVRTNVEGWRSNIKED